jgi:hypothetical protein
LKRDAFSLTLDEINGLVNHLLKDLKPKSNVTGLDVTI